MPSLRSIARFTVASSTDLFHVGNSWRAKKRAARGHAVYGEGLVVPAPHGDGRVVAEQIDGGFGLTPGLLSDATRVAPLQREVLPYEEAALVGRVVELGAGDMGVHTQQVEAGTDGQVDVAHHLVG